ncbi:HAD family hydrolase [Streptomyces sp. 8K308]|uniref:HAD family hydrolase n=1 Tax=Streptomyces sp. 8K308 TaxID=2530388 RepID=UPI001045736D|nr:haloacid dehalogenase-like hydrolase [Streptomyces sp. 8K308]TDC27696.1 HAD family hydrolase [Streptomyces sp. 8K308]
MRLVLWDIDHTLIDMRGVGGRLFAEAFEHALGTPQQHRIRIDGLTDPVIFRKTAIAHGITITDDDFERFAQRLAELHLTRMPEIREQGHALPGAASALAALAAEPDVRQTVVTGNLRATAPIKLKVYGLDGPIDWDAGAYGQDANERAGLVRAALRRAASQWGTIDPARVTLFGDTPADMIGAVENGVRAIGIATGRSTENDLRKAGAAATFPDLTATEEVVKASGGATG